MIKVYVSHTIQGKMREKATNEYVHANEQRAIEFTNKLKKLFPKVEFYCPGEHNTFTRIAYLNGYITEEQILDIDCKIIDTCNLVLNYSPDGYFSNGMQVENNHANLHNIPTITMKDTSQAEREKLERFLESLMKG